MNSVATRFLLISNLLTAPVSFRDYVVTSASKPTNPQAPFAEPRFLRALVVLSA